MKTTRLANGLSVRANGCLATAGIPAEKTAVIQALATQTIFPYRFPRLYGKTTHYEVCRWTGIDPETLQPLADPRYAICPHCHNTLTPDEIVWRTGGLPTPPPA